MGEMKIAGRTVRTLRHGMAGAPGLEIWGPYEPTTTRSATRSSRPARVRPRAGRLARLLVEHARVGLDPLAAAGDLLRRGACGVPRVAAGQRATRPSTRSPAASSPTNIEDYYLNPWELGYGPFVKFDHDFIGREALEKIDRAGAAQEGHARLERRGPGEDLRLAVRPDGETTSSSTCRSRTTARRNYDPVIDDGKTVGLSMFTGYSANERRGLSLATSTPTSPSAPS